MNVAHNESLELLKIVNDICVNEDLKYTIIGPSLIAYEYGLDFNDCIPINYIALMYPDYKILCRKLEEYSNEHPEYSYHYYENTRQMNAFEGWFVKEAKIVFPERKKEDAFYYGTRMVISPVFYVGETKEDWCKAYQLFEDTVYTMNIFKPLKRKPLKSFIKLLPKRKLQNKYIKKRDYFTYERCIEAYGEQKKSEYTVYPFVINSEPNNRNSVNKIVNDNSKYMTLSKWNDVEKISLWGVECYCVRDRKTALSCYPQYYVEMVIEKDKSQLLLNGNTYLWRVQQIQLELLREFDRICRKYNIKYNIGFGSLLGAIRHGGFIPWDDDIDVTIRSEDFDLLDKIMENELDKEKYYFRTPTNEKNNHLIFKHLERKGTVFTKPGREKLEQSIGVFIDIFPMYPSAHLFVSDWIHARICRYWRTALWATIGADSVKDEKERRKYKRMARPGNKRCYENFVKAATFFKNKKYLKFWIAMDRNPYKVDLVKASNFTDAIEMEFEGISVMVPPNYAAVLDYALGEDWRLYPSVRNRMPAHNAIMEIGDLYLDESQGCIK